jgi:S-adenosylhomocysteine hydrolase
MINEDVSNRTVSIQVRAGKKIADELLKTMKVLMAKSKQTGGLEEYLKQEGSEIKLKDLVKKGQLEEIEVKEPELKELRKELNKHGVKFSILRDKESGNYNVFFQAKDTKVMDVAFSKALQKAEQKHDKKQSVKKQINQFKEKIKETVTKDKIKNKHKEQSL